ncbi:GAF domain-containing protein [Streptomyces sp. NPDC059002]|uniref:GAF domain-containing protein n=1 Tax=Streptomyces sp. NPDC059002 TaxID=3346690 RepID=UPI0036750FCC
MPEGADAPLPSMPLLDAVLSVGTDLELRATLQHIVDSAARLTGAEHGALHVNAAAHGGRAELFVAGDRPPPASAAAGDSIGMPIHVHDEAFGDLLLAHKAWGPFTDEDRQLLKVLASQAGIAIGNARLFETARQRERWIEGAAAVTTALLTGEAAVDALMTVADRARILAGAAAGVILQPTDSGGMTIVAAATDGAPHGWGTSADARGGSGGSLEPDTPRGRSEGSLEPETPRTGCGASHEPDTPRAESGASHGPDTAPTGSSPSHKPDTTRAGSGASHGPDAVPTGTGHPHKPDTPRARCGASHGPDTAPTGSRTSREADDDTRPHPSPKTPHPTDISHPQDRTPAHPAPPAPNAPGSPAPRAAAGSRQDAGHNDLIGTTIEPGSAVLEQLLGGEPVFIEDSATDPRMTTHVRARFGPSMMLPLQAGGRLIGTLALPRRRGAPAYTPAERLLATQFASQAALALVLADAQQSRQRLAVFEDRDRIARDLHDLVVQRLFATGMMLESTRRRARSATVESTLDHAVDELESTIQEVRTAIFALQQPPADAPTTFRGKVLRETAGAAAVLGVQPSTHFAGAVDTQVTEPAAGRLLAALRRALATTSRRTDVSRVDVTVDARATLPDGRTGVRLTVYDDGATDGVEAGTTVTWQAPL